MTATATATERVEMMTFTTKTWNNMKHLKSEHTTKRESSVTMIPAMMKGNIPTWDMSRPLKCRLSRLNKTRYANFLIKIQVRTKLLHKYQDI